MAKKLLIKGTTANPAKAGSPATRKHLALGKLLAPANRRKKK